MRPLSLATGSSLWLLLVVAARAWASNDCQIAFEKWAMLSSAFVRVVPASESHGADGRGACVPTEAVRKDLLDGLARTRGACAELLSSTDQSARQTRTLLSINQSFIASLAVCGTISADSGADWTTRSAPAPEKPRVAAPLPAPREPVVAAPPVAPPRPVVVTPPPAPPRPVVVAPPAVLQKPEVAAPPPTPPCLEIQRAKDELYALVNRRCRGHAVLAVIETRGSGGETVCRGHTISDSLPVRTSKNAPPRVNYECVLSQGPCNKGRLGNMFPECDWE